MSYESTNHFYSNHNIRPQHMMTMNPTIGSNYYNGPSSQSQPQNHYPLYPPSSSSHQTVSF